MIDELVIPDADPIPLPAPFWLLKLLLLLTFFLHVVPMNFLLGGGVLTAVADTLGRRKNDANLLSLAERMGKALPFIVAAAITFGVAPLLFIQVLYGQFFYTSSVVIAAPWIAVIPILILAYYGLYYYTFRWKELSGKRLIVIWLSALLFIVISFVYTNNMTLMLEPSRWDWKYFSSEIGMQLNVGGQAVVVRWLHFVVGASAVAGIYVVITGLLAMKREAGFGRFAVKYGGRWFIAATLVQFAVGIFFLLSLPNEVKMLFLGWSRLGTGLLVAAILFAIVGIVLLFLAGRAGKPGFPALSGIVCITLTIVSMIVIRDMVRNAYLSVTGVNVAGYPVDMPVEIFALFALFLVVVIVAIIVMLRKALAPKAPETA